MNTQITVQLPEKTYRRAQRLAQLTRRSITEVLTDTLDLSLPAFDAEATSSTSPSILSDQEVIALTDLQMDATDDAQLSVLLDKQQSGRLTAAEQPELARLMQIYQEGLLRKAEALAEAVNRGLLPPLAS